MRDNLILIKEFSLDQADRQRLHQRLQLIKNLKIVLNFDNLDVGDRFFQVLFALFLAGDWPGQVHFVDVCEQEFEIVVDLCSDFILEVFVIVVAEL